jgi:hypothetical protein
MGRGRHRAGPTRAVRRVRAAGVIIVSVAAVLGLTVFAPPFLPWSTAKADQRFVAAVQAQGRTVEPGPTETLVISAAHKLCDRRLTGTSAPKKSDSLSADEIAAVQRTFGDDQQAFLKVATRSYCGG